MMRLLAVFPWEDRLLLRCPVAACRRLRHHRRQLGQATYAARDAVALALIWRYLHGASARTPSEIPLFGWLARGLRSRHLHGTGWIELAQ